MNYLDMQKYKLPLRDIGEFPKCIKIRVFLSLNFNQMTVGFGYGRVQGKY